MEERKTFTGTGKDGDRIEGVFDSLDSAHIIYHSAEKSGDDEQAEEGV